MNDFLSEGAVRHGRHPGGLPDAEPDRQPLDPGALLTSLGFLAYSWELGSGALSFAGDVNKVLPGQWGHRFENVACLEESRVSPAAGARHAALFGEERLDDGSGVPYALTYRLRSKDGRLFLVEESGRWFACLPGHPISARGLLRVRALATEAAEEASSTGEMPYRSLGRGALREVLGRAAEQAQRTRRAFTLIAVVAAYGQVSAQSQHLPADDAGEAFSARLRRVMRRGDCLVRIDDQISLCVLNACDEIQMATAVKRLENAFEFPMDSAGGPQLLGAVAGVTWKGSHANSDALAATVIERAKVQFDAGRGAGTAEPSGEMPSDARSIDSSSIDWHKEVLEALNERRLALACQPVVNSKSRSIAFQEGLLRLRNRAGRFLPASVFIPTSEENGLVNLLDRRVIELAAGELGRHPDLKLSINASAQSLADPGWLAALCSYGASSNLFAGRLILEITESTAILDIRRTTELLTKVKELGIRVAIDDFGAGHTSFRALRHLPIDIIKIDGTFVQDVDRSSDGRFFIRTLIDLARHIGCKVVAEWVENEASARIVEEIGVDFLQGRLLGVPRPLAQPILPVKDVSSGRLTA